MTNEWNKSALVVWKNGRKEWLKLSDIDRKNGFYRAIQQGFIVDVETIEVR